MRLVFIGKINQTVDVCTRKLNPVRPLLVIGLILIPAVLPVGFGAPLTTNQRSLQLSGQVNEAVPDEAENISLYTRVPSESRAT